MTKFWRQPVAGYDPWAVDKRKYAFHQDVAERVIAFWESNFTLSKAGTPFLLEDWQKQVVGHLFGWKEIKSGLRRYRVLWVYVPRKNGKTEMGAGLALILLVADNEPGAEVYSAAADTEQAKIVYNSAAAMVRRNPQLEREIRIFEGYKSMKYEAAMSYWRVLSSDAGSKHGLNPHGRIVDEVHAHKNAELMEVLETGTGARKQPLGIHMTTADYARDSACNEYHDYAKRVRDEQIDDSWFPVIYEMTPDDDWHNEANWKKVNPNLGVSKTWDYMRQQHHKAKLMPSFENTFKRLELNVQTTAKNKWLNVSDWDAGEQRGVKLEDMEGEDCYASIDMGSTRDLTACGLFFPEHMLYFCKFWTPEETMAEKLEYQLWNKQGWLWTTPGRTINDEYMRTYIRDDINERFSLLDVGYDPWNAAGLALRLGEDDGIPVIEIRQGYKSLNEPSKKLEKLVVDHLLLHCGNPILRWMVGNCEIQTDPAGSIKPVKPHKDSPKKIDGIITLVMCIALWINNERGEREQDAYKERYEKTGDAMMIL